jgi:tRNA A-37 threonylcarbamoyl transferase component Bud32
MGNRARASTGESVHERRSTQVPIVGAASPDDSVRTRRYEPVKEHSRLGPYQIVCELASGGMASVYLALYRSVEGFEKLCAVKRIHPHLANERPFTEMFADEARIAARISHPFVCSVFSFGRSRQSHYIAMEFLRGEPLSAIARRVMRTPELGDDPRYPALAARLVANFAEGLHAAHTLRDDLGQPLEIVHRDVTPQNLFVLYDGTVRVTDFGIAHARRRLHQTQGQKVKGKLSYVAPEQLSDGPIDNRVDIWGLGVTLWELLSGRRLFLGSSEGETVSAVLSRAVPPPSAYRASVPVELDRIVLRALERDVTKRYGTARDLARDLERFLAAGGDQVPAMDVAEWMASVFPRGAERIQALTELAARVSAETADETVVRVPSVAPAAGGPAASYVFMAASPFGQRHASSSPPTAVYPPGITAEQIDASLGAILVPRAPSLESPPARSVEPRAPRLELVAEVTRTHWLDGDHGRTVAFVGSILLVAAGVFSWLAREPETLAAGATLSSAVSALPVAAASPALAPRAAEPPVSIDAVPIDGLAVEKPRVSKRPSGSASPVAPAPSEAPPPTSFGELYVTGGAGDLLEGGQPLGAAPGHFRLSVGPHTLTLRLPSGDLQTMQVDIKPGAPTLVTVSAPR